MGLAMRFLLQHLWQSLNKFSMATVDSTRLRVRVQPSSLSVPVTRAGVCRRDALHFTSARPRTGHRVVQYWYTVFRFSSKRKAYRHPAKHLSFSMHLTRIHSTVPGTDSSLMRAGNVRVRVLVPRGLVPSYEYEYQIPYSTRIICCTRVRYCTVPLRYSTRQSVSHYTHPNIQTRDDRPRREIYSTVRVQYSAIVRYVTSLPDLIYGSPLTP